MSVLCFKSFDVKIFMCVLLLISSPISMRRLVAVLYLLTTTGSQVTGPRVVLVNEYVKNLIVQVQFCNIVITQSPKGAGTIII